MKNRINRGRFSRLVICIIIFSALLIGLRAENFSDNRSGKIKILILSKHIRLIKEGKLKFIQMYLPDGGEIDTGGKRISSKTLSVSFINDLFNVKTEKDTIGKGNFTLYPKEKGDLFSIDINGEKRFYPLPLYINNTGAEIELSIEETVNQFAVDSAWGELGNRSDRCSEVLYALAHLIKARCYLPYITNKHKGYDFCDLTCCQTYKGRSGKIFDDPVSIKTGNIKNGLFFHSSGGGKLFTDSIFNNRGRTSAPPKDIIYQQNLLLSREKYLSWEAVIPESELSEILYTEKSLFLKNISFDRDKEVVFIENSNGKEPVSPESFRIKVNRVKGWNFIKSNNYNITRTGGVYKFTGSGLGHGTGMSLEGALQLAERGYSRYEILEHYYPELEYNVPSPLSVNPRLQYIVFNSDSGEIIRISGGNSFQNRVIPCGSIFKLFIALYLAEQRPDLFHSYSFTCTDLEKNKVIPVHCWKKPGHGKMNISSALYNSCNKYFASLYNRIDPDDFKIWLSGFAGKNGIELNIPDTKSQNDFSNLLAGLNFNLTITIEGIMKLNRYIYMKNKISSSEETEIIFNALHKTFTEGTAKKTAAENSFSKISPPYKPGMDDLWGKTGTVISGTNSHHGYGIFTGGMNSTGIVAILRKGTGAAAARESGKILFEYH